MTVLAATERRLTPEQLGELFLFESLDEEKLRWLADHGWVAAIPAGTEVYREGEPAEAFVVLLSGTVVMTRRVQRDEVEVSRTDHRGAYGGATQAYLGDRVPQQYANTMRAVTDAELLVLPAKVFAKAVAKWFPMPTHLLEGLFFGIRNSERVVGQRERLIALGSLSAGLTHELNNPAAAAARAASSLRERMGAMRQKLALLASGAVDGEMLAKLAVAQEDAVASVARAPKLSVMATSEREDELLDWLDEHGVGRAWELAPVFVAAGLDVPWAEGVLGTAGAQNLEGALRWLAYTVETEQLLDELDDATRRISALVGAAKQYSQMDRAPYQDIDIHEGLESTLVMLGRRIGDGVTVVTEFDRTLPHIAAYAAELNQVWTNLIDNAVAAMRGHGTLKVRTSREDTCVLVEIGDTGSGIPQELQQRIFEPFFTTKPVGEGTGLGLDISWRIVVTKHGGDIRVASRPGETWFRVRLPISRPVEEE